MKKEFYSNGKLLITGEYVVLDGATALALPTRLGQNLIVNDGNPGEIHWTSFDHEGAIWFSTTILFDEIQTKVHLESQPERNTLISILHEASRLNPHLLNKEEGYSVESRLYFPRNWGLGSSSTLINNVAQWFDIDAFTLLNNSFGGSGYDIACAQSPTAVLYKIANGQPAVTRIAFEPEFRSHLYFVYLNQKQNSRSAISSYYAKGNTTPELIESVTRITTEILHCNDWRYFGLILEQHEKLLSECLGMPGVQEELFPDFHGTVKSLGAWGGDFVLVVSETNPSAYFAAKGYTTILPYAEIIL